MKCIKVRESLEAFADGEIGFSERKNILSHLGSCDDCKTEFESLQAISKTMKQTLPVVTPMTLDAKVFNAFENHHSVKQTNEKQEKIGWFGIPKFAFASALLLLALFSGFAFQLGRMSVGNVKNPSPVMAESDNTFAVENKQNTSINNDENETRNVVTKVVEIPVIKEKIVKVPIIKEKVVTRTVYVNRKQSNKTKSTKDNFALNSSVKDGEVLTNTNLKGFKPVAVIKPKITKKEE